jgi:hypothetical protein
MKTSSVLIGVQALLLAGLFCSSYADSDKDKADNLRTIKTRVLQGHDEALLEAATLPAEIAIPFLHKYIHANREKKGSRFTAARSALLRIPHYEKYYADRLAAATAAKGVDEEAFETLAVIDTPECAAVVAPYLFDFYVHKGHGDMLADINGISAAQALGAMTIADAPTTKHPGTYQSKDYIAWQEWAIRKGFVPKSSKVGVPNGFKEAFDDPAPESASPNEKPLPTASEVLAPASASPPAANIVAQRNHPKDLILWLLASVFILGLFFVIVAGALKRRT